jgi:hypothetical protein
MARLSITEAPIRIGSEGRKAFRFDIGRAHGSREL